MKKVYYILSSFIISIILLLTLQSKAYASGATIAASPSTIEKGQSATINADIKDASAWSLDISTTGGKLTKVDSRAGTTESGNNESTTIKLGTFSADSSGTYTITLSGYVVDGVSLSKINVPGTIQITVTDPKPVTPPETQKPEAPKQEPEQPKVEEKPNFTDANKTMYARKTINLRESWSTDSKATLVAGGTELKVTGTSTNKVNDFVWYRVSYNGQTKYVASYLLTEEKPVEEKPQEEPIEDPAEEPNEEPETNEEPTAEKQTLTSLEIEGITLSPKFDPEVYEYRVIVKEDISQLKINAVSDIEGAVVSIAGNENLQEGENLITIVVYNAQNEAQATYQITTNKTTIDLSQTDKILQMGTKEAKRNATIFISILGMTFVALIVVMILRARSKKEDYNEEEQADLNNEEATANKNIEISLENKEEKATQSTETKQPVEIEGENSDTIKENDTKVTKQSTEKEINVENIMNDAKRQEYIDTIISEKRKGKHF